MSTKLNPYLNFPGTAREAMTFYQSVFGGTLEVMTFADAGAEGVPDPQQVMHAYLESTSGYVLMASDLPPGTEHQPGSSISLRLSGDAGEELGVEEGDRVAVADIDRHPAIGEVDPADDAVDRRKDRPAGG